MGHKKETSAGTLEPPIITEHSIIMELCLNKSDNSTCPEMPYEESRTLLVAVYSIVFAIGLPANCLTSLLTFVQIRRKKVHAIYIFSLSLCDLMYLSTLPFWITYVQNGHKWNMGDIPCKIIGFIFFCNIYISILLLCCISLDRYIGLVYSLESKGRREQKKVIKIVCALFAVVALIHTPVFLMEEKETCFETVPLSILLSSLNIARFIFGFAIPFMILIFTNYNIFQTTKRSSSLTCHQKNKVKTAHAHLKKSENIREETYRSLRRWRWNSTKLNSSTDHNTDTIKLETPKESQEGGQREENREIADSSDIQACTSARDQESGS
uniref:G-protein coupled receptors family 1 profile domain-containing protein n=1 Tax=Ficedula albicollis TaxID=59894 RepID=U3KKI6_FICAL